MFARPHGSQWAENGNIQIQIMKRHRWTVIGYSRRKSDPQNEHNPAIFSLIGGLPISSRIAVIAKSMPLRLLLMRKQGSKMLKKRARNANGLQEKTYPITNRCFPRSLQPGAATFQVT